MLRPSGRVVFKESPGNPQIDWLISYPFSYPPTAGLLLSIADSKPCMTSTRTRGWSFWVSLLIKYVNHFLLLRRSILKLILFLFLSKFLQEPGSDEEIQNFCSLNYGVTFPLMKKSDVNGDNTNEVYKWLKNEKSGILGLTRIKVKTTTSYSYSMTYPKIIIIIRLLVEFWDVFGRQEWKSGESLGVFDNTRVYRWWYCQYDWVESFFFSWIAAVVCMYVCMGYSVVRIESFFDYSSRYMFFDWNAFVSCSLL